MKGPFFPSDILKNGRIPSVDAHIHTTWTDGRSSFDEYALRAKELGLEAIAFTEHMDNSSPWFDNYLSIQAQVRELAAPVKVYFGGEIKVSHNDGTINLCIDRIRQLDFVVGVLHRYPDGKGGYRKFSELSPEEAIDLDFRLSKALLTNHLVDVWGHPAGVYATYFGAYSEEMLRELLSIAIREGKVVEVNSKPRYSPVLPIIYKKCLECDCLVSIGSDAHEVGELGDAYTLLSKMQLNSKCCL